MIDTHSHLYFQDYDEDRSAVVQRAVAAGVSSMLMPYVDKSTHAAMLAAAAEYPQCSAMMGLHPTAVGKEYGQELDYAMEQLAKHPAAYTAIGEIGLDAYWCKDYMQEQKSVFTTMLGAAYEYDLPVVIHCREAFDLCFDVIKQFNKPLRGVFHAFSDSISTYKRIKLLGDFMVGIGGIVTFKNSLLSEVVRDIPMSDIVLETDAPYLTPAPFRGKRNESAYLTYVVQRIAQVKQLPAEEVCAVTTTNAQRMLCR